MRWSSVVSRVLVSAAAASALQAQDLDAIQKRGVLKVLLVAPPPQDDRFWSVRPEAPPGFEREMIEKFAGVHGLRVEVVPQKTWADLIPALVAGAGDVVAGRFSDTPGRRAQIAFSAEVFPTRNVAVTLKPHRVVAAVEELKDERVGTVRGTSLEEAVQHAKVPVANVVPVAPGTLLQALKDGKASCIVWGTDQAILAQRADRDVQIGAFVGSPGSLAWGLRKDAPQLLAGLNEFIAAHRLTEWSKLVVKYFGPDAPELLRKARAL